MLSSPPGLTFLYLSFSLDFLLLPIRVPLTVLSSLYPLSLAICLSTIHYKRARTEPHTQPSPLHSHSGKNDARSSRKIRRSIHPSIHPSLLVLSVLTSLLRSLCLVLLPSQQNLSPRLRVGGMWTLLGVAFCNKEERVMERMLEGWGNGWVGITRFYFRPVLFLRYGRAD